MEAEFASLHKLALSLLSDYMSEWPSQSRQGFGCEFGIWESKASGDVRGELAMDWHCRFSAEGCCWGDA